ncbi:hypothetical protein KPH14_001480 [Odynerus spinipes]|uniref:Astakine n=1 Tax=Odynerus spinipes TaxID=1348599 RepID=A0AAD9RUK1_9HYME|nr:hypothetical protein KPH14_001480 [Odynerus spinipes]
MNSREIINVIQDMHINSKTINGLPNALKRAIAWKFHLTDVVIPFLSDSLGCSLWMIYEFARSHADQCRGKLGLRVTENNRIMSSSSAIFTSLLLLGLVGTLLAASITKREEPLGVQCHSDKDCPPNHCCVISPLRYSLPQCSPLREKAEICRPPNDKINATLEYPNNSRLTITDVSYVLCPCNHGLTCDPKEGFCK